MSDAPPPYPGPGGYPPPNAPYPPPQQGYPPPPQQGYPPPQQQGYPPPQQQGYPPQPYGEPSKAGYGPPPGQPPMQGYAPYPGAPGAQQQGTHTHNTVVVSQPAITVVQTYRESPVHCNCPHCRAEVVTGVHYESGTFSWVVCCILWWIGCGLGCCLIPFCMDGCKDVIHTCPNCNQQVARWSRM